MKPESSTNFGSRNFKALKLDFLPLILQDTSLNPPPPLKNEIVVDRLASIQIRGRYESLKKEASELDSQIKQLHDALDTLLRIQQRYVHVKMSLVCCW